MFILCMGDAKRMAPFSEFLKTKGFNVSMPEEGAVVKI